MWSVRPDHREAAAERACSFCSGRESDLPLLIAGEAAQICPSCARNAARAIGRGERVRYRSAAQRTPAAIKAALDEWVIGQEHAKRVLAVAVHNHAKRRFRRAVGEEGTVGKSNVLMIGPPGSGKTLLAKRLARLVDAPVAIVAATTLTQAGYAGRDVDEIAAVLVTAAGYDLAAAEAGIVYIDEIDKLAARPDGHGGRPDIGGFGVQRSLLGLLEGRPARLDGAGARRRRDDTFLDTTEVLFIAGGSFAGLAPPAGPAAEEALIAFGLMPELVGRLPVIVTLAPPSHAELVRILSEPKGALLEQYKRLFRLSGAELAFRPCALDEIAATALARGDGARGLRAILEAVLLDDMFELGGAATPQPIVIDRDLVRRRLQGRLRQGPPSPPPRRTAVSHRQRIRIA